MSNLEIVDRFWSESCLFYQFKDVKPYLLKLQNDYDKNINRLLFSLWFSHWQKRLLTEEEIDNINVNTQLLENWIKEIRKLRVEYSQINDETRKRILDYELKLEKIHQKTLINNINLNNPKSDLLETNLLILNLEKLLNMLDNKLYQPLIDLWSEFIENN